MAKPHATLLAEFQANQGAPLVSIRNVEAQLAVAFPAEYVEFLQQANGGEGPVGAESYVILWPVDELVERNEVYKVDDEYAPGLTFIGTDGGNEVFAIRRTDNHFVRAPLIGMAPDVVDDTGSTLEEFLRSFT